MSMNEKFYISRAEDASDLTLPAYMTDGAAGMDLYANVHEDVAIPRGEIRLIPVGIKIALPKGFEAQIRPRSGLALKYGITVLNSPGTVDCDYRGEIKVLLINHGNAEFVVKRGERIAQMIIGKYESIQWAEKDSLDGTIRGDGGYGHTGK